MAGNNPIGFSDLFDFSDNKEILDAIELVKELKKSYKEFISDVSGAAVSQFSSAQKGVADEIAKVAKATQDLNVTNEKSQQTLLDNLKVIEQLKAENDALKKSKQGAKQVEDDLTLSVNSLTAKLNEQIKAFKSVNYSTAEGQKEMNQWAAAIRVTKTEISDLNDRTKITNTIFNASKASYNQLDAETKLLIKDLKNLTDIQGVNKGLYDQLSQKIADNTALLKKYDAQIGQNFRNVGNYKSAFNGLQYSIAQVTRELPNFALNAQTGFLAISNNLPILADELQKAKMANDSLNESGSKGVPVFKQVLKSFFSWQTALVALISLSVIFGKKIGEWISQLFKGSNVVSDYELRMRRLTQVNEEAAKSTGAELTQLELLYKQSQNQTLSLTQRKEAVDQLQKQYPSYFKNLQDEAILAGKAAGQYTTLKDSIIKAGLARAAAKVAAPFEDQLFKLEEQINKLEDRAQGAISSIKQYSAPQQTTTPQQTKPGKPVTIQELQAAPPKPKQQEQQGGDILSTLRVLKEQRGQLLSTITQIYSDAGVQASDAFSDKFKIDDKAEKALRDAVRRMDEVLQAAQRLEIANEELIYSKSAKTAQDEIKLEDDKYATIEKFSAKRLALYQKGSKEQLSIQAQLVQAEKDHSDKILQIKDNEIKRVVDLNVKQAQADFDKSNKGYNAEVDFENAKLAALEDGYNKQLLLYQKDSDEYQKILQDKVNAESVAAGKIDQIRRAQQKAQEGVDQSNKDVSSTAQEFRVRKQYVNTGEAGQFDLEKKLHDLRMANLIDEVDQKMKTLSTLKEGDADYYDTEKQLAELRKQQVVEEGDFQIKQAERVYQRKKDLEQALFDFVTNVSGQLFDIGREINQAKLEDLQNQQDKELELAGNNAQAKAKIESDFHQKMVALQRKQAIFDKLQGLLDVGINTAVAVSKAIAASPLTFGQPWVTYAVIQGAVEAAAILAKPLPKYKGGRRGGKKEYARVNEEGVELIGKNGKYRIVGKGKETTTLLHEGEDVKTAKETQKIFEKAVEKNDYNRFIDSLLEGTGVVRQYEEKKEKSLLDAMITNRLSPEVLKEAFSESIENMPFTSLSFDERGIRRYANKLHSKIELMNSRNTLGGNG